MRYWVVILCLVCACRQSKTTQVPNERMAPQNNLISTESMVLPSPKGALDWTNLVQLMESLANLPFEQRRITLKTIKEEAIKLGKQTWPAEWDNNPIRSRYTVFLTHTSIAADQRLGNDPINEQATFIAQMKQSWNVFAQRTTAQESTVLNTTVD